jgi:flagellar motor protein MotB
MKTSVLLLLLTLYLSSFGQLVTIDKKNITPGNVTEIGGTGYFNDTLYLLLPGNIRYNGKIAEASESKSISQKYRIWDIFKLDETTNNLENMGNKWNINDASPNGFCIVNDSTVVYTNKKSQFISNQPEFNRLISKINNSNYQYTDPAWDDRNKRLYYSSNQPGGKGGMDIWYFETEGEKTGEITNVEKLNSSLNELSPTLPNDSLILFVSNKNGKQYDIAVFDNLKKEILKSTETLGANEFFTLSPIKGSLYYITPTPTSTLLWKGNYLIKETEPIATIVPATIQKIEVKIEPEPTPELIKQPEAATEDPNFKLTNYFGLAKYDLTPMMKDSLDKIASMLIENPMLSIVICGHASPDGPEGRNMMLSFSRANEAYNWLLKKGVKAERIVRVYGGEYLFNGVIEARMFSIFTIEENDLPKQLAIVPANMMGSAAQLYPIYNTDSDETNYWRFTLNKYLPVSDEQLLLLPVNNLHYVVKDETLYSLSIKYEITIKRMMDANGLKNESVAVGMALFIP